MSRSKITALVLALLAAGLALWVAPSASSASSPAPTDTSAPPANRWVAAPGPCPLVIPGTRPSEGAGWAIGPVEVTQGAKFTAYVPASCDDSTINTWAFGAWQVAPDLVIYRLEPADKTGSTVAKLTKEAIFGGH